MASSKPRCFFAHSADAATSATVREMADWLMFTLSPFYTLYSVHRTRFNARSGRMIPMGGARTGQGEPSRTLALLWRAAGGGEPPRRRGPGRAVSVDEVVEAALGLADE